MRRTIFSTGVLLTLVLIVPFLPAADEPVQARTTVLDTAGFWRVYHVIAPPVVRTDAGLKPVLGVGQPWFHERSPEPPADWTRPGFDDNSWLRGPARIACESSVIARLCLRGKFIVTDLDKVDDLRLTVGYYGGAIVYVNGVELKRGHLGPGEAGRNGLAEIYPESVYYHGNVHDWNWLVSTRYKWEKKRVRTFSEVPIPRDLLRKGVNVLAIETIRPPERASALLENGKRHRRRKTLFATNWGKCSVRWVRLSSANGDGIVQNAVRPKGMQVWNSDLLAPDFDMDFGDATERLRPVTIAGCRNGAFSGKIVVGSDKPINGLRASMGPLRGPGVIAPASVRIRYGFPWGSDANAMWRYVYPAAFLGALAESPSPTIPVSKPAKSHYYGLKVPDALTPVFGAVRSVWVTVDVPKHTPPGLYRGTLTIGAKGERPVEVPVELTVEDWTLPDTDDYTTWVELMQSTDTLVLEYGLKPWSNKHWTMIAQSMKHLNRIGSRILYIPVICHTNLGNDESMVRWIPRPDGTYTWDFSIMDRYLDTALAHMGRPKVVCFWVWEKFMFPTVDDPKTFEQYRPNRRPARAADGATEYIGRGPKVTVLDPATGKIEKQHLPYLLAPESKAIWRPLFEEIRKRMAARGLADAVMLGTPSDVVLRKDHFAFFNDVAPGLRWVNHSHMDITRVYESANAKLGYYTTVFGGNFFPQYPESGRYYGWKRKWLHVYMLRNWGRNWDHFPITSWRHLAEVNITGKQRGVGHLGAEFWKVVKDKRGNRRGRIYLRYPEGNWRSNDICTALLAPGREGPVATHRYEMMREGVQECEARIFIEKALLDNPDASGRAKLGDDLAKRCQDALDERIRYMIKGMSDLEIDSSINGPATNAYSTWWNRAGIQGHKWFVASGWRERTRKLFALAGEVTRELDTR